MDLRRKSKTIKLFFFFFLVCSLSPCVISDPLSPAPYSGGYFDFSLSSRVFELPVFGSSSPISFMFLGSQLFVSGAELSLWADTGYPRTTTGLGFEISRLPVSNGMLNIRGGDLGVRPLAPQSFLLLNSSSFPVQGFGLQYGSSNFQWSLSGGRAKHSVGTPDLNLIGQPSVFQAEVLQRLRRNYIGFTVTGVKDPVMVNSNAQIGWSSALTGRFYHQFSPVALFSGEILFSQQGSTGGSVGLQRNFQSGELGFSAYFYGNDFPYLPPVFRPGEMGARIAGRYYASESSILFGQVNYYRDTLVRHRSDFRGYIGYGRSLGDSRPYIQAAYYREQTDFDPFSIVPLPGFETDRFSVSLSRASLGAFSNFRLEHLIGNQMKARSQAIYDFRKVFRQSSFLNGSFVAQREEGSGFGGTGEASIERPWKPRYYYLLGVGAGYRHTDGRNSGEGTARFGLSRRITDSGLRAQIEVTVPFPIGLQRSSLGHSQILFNIGQRFAWNNRESAAIASFTSPTGEYGSIEGVVRNQQKGLQGLTVMINGQPKGITGPNGRFQISRVPAGPISLSLDTRALDTGISIIGGLIRPVLVVSKQITTVDFVAASLLYFKGAVVCDPGKQPARGLHVSLFGKDASFTTMTSDVGGFQFDPMPAGNYVLSMKPQQGTIATTEIPKVDIVLTQDVLSKVIRIDCTDMIAVTPQPVVPAAMRPDTSELQKIAPVKQPPVIKQNPEVTEKDQASATKSLTATPPHAQTSNAPGPLQMLQNVRLAEAAAAWQTKLNHSDAAFTIQLAVACQESTVQQAADLIQPSNLFVVPMNYRGRHCFRILHGTYDRWSSAEAARTTLPAVYLKQESPAVIVRVKKLQR